ncbi:hypothetical protein [Adhaeribacter soli]|uniref:Uncharacterized protein n=1 Tax=Adhaeribacter soli TaxID=2607655 RepID=A0A5N1JAB7_9BACT|nr:hypothetical protein [Adhaeribacter soli]KAA9345789.1 hypothetical protein F0P94_01510 [Adhaeribacter soli]
MNKLVLLFTFLTLLVNTASAQDQNINEKNKALFDQTVDKVNFRTIEFVYDRKYPRKKFPPTQADFKSRKTFDDFEGNAKFKTLFLNYNDVSERFKNKFGKGKHDLATFEKGLNDILINKDFEFFISSLTKDDKIQLIRSLQQINKKGIAQFVDAAGKPRGIFASDSVIPESADPIVKKKNARTTTVAGDAAADSSQAVINTDATPEEVFQENKPRRDWLSWMSLLFSLGALALAASTKFKDIPGLRSFVVNNYQKRDGSQPVKAAIVTPAQSGAPDPATKKQLDNLTREVEGLYAQMDELLHKNAVLEQKLASTHPKPYDLPKTAFLEPEVKVAEPVAKAAGVTAISERNTPATNYPEVETEDELDNDEEDSRAYASHSLAVGTSGDEAPEEFSADIDNAAVTYFLSKPDRHGFFWNDELNRSFVPGRSLFTLELSESNQKKGQFEFVDNPAQQKLALENPELYLLPVCEIEGDLTSGTRLQNDTPGTIVLNGDQWVLVKKARVRVV